MRGGELDGEEPRLIGETQIRPEWTLDIEDDGSMAPRMPERFTLKDQGRIRPVAPFIEIWCDTGADNDAANWIRQPLIGSLLAAEGLGRARLSFRVTAMNAKASRRAGDPALRYGTFPPVEIAGDDHARKPLRGVSPPDTGGRPPMIAAGRSIPLGSVQVIRPRPRPADEGVLWAEAVNVDTLRLRVTPARGAFYGPPGAKEVVEPPDRRGAELPPEQRRPSRSPTTPRAIPRAPWAAPTRCATATSRCPPPRRTSRCRSAPAPGSATGARLARTLAGLVPTRFGRRQILAARLPGPGGGGAPRSHGERLLFLFPASEEEVIVQAMVPEPPADPAARLAAALEETRLARHCVSAPARPNCAAFDAAPARPRGALPAPRLLPPGAEMSRAGRGGCPRPALAPRSSVSGNASRAGAPGEALGERPFSHRFVSIAPSALAGGPASGNRGRRDANRPGRFAGGRGGVQ